MKFTLKDYQDDAVAQVLDRLKKARKRWHEDQEMNAFSLTATTGAGKTVMAAAVFEALFFGSDDYEFEADPGAVVIWFSDDPSLNEQSKFRLMEAADKLTVSDLVTVENTFARERFEAGKIYFLNTQKLSKTSLLVRGHDPEDNGVEVVNGLPLMPDARAHTIWDTIRNTIEDPDLTLYLVLDEAHRGMRDAVKGTRTLVTRLINGQGGVPGVPVVWGISATVQRFDEAVKSMQDRTALPNVVVNSKLVQDSGLLKDTINLDVPDETGDFATVLLRRGTGKLRDITKAWDAYAAEQGESGKVTPLMVLQVPNTPSATEIGTWLQTIFDTWPEIPTDSVYNVFGEKKTENFGGYSVPYIAPERVQESEHVRILLAKEAISTGWDCPRAEVMVSFRAASDQTHITQLLGRMVRTPLARRIPGNERLSAVDCLLPNFNQATVKAVVQALMTGDDPGETRDGRRVLINPKEMSPNPAVPKEVWDKLLSLPSKRLPKKQARPIKRLTGLAHELAADAILPDAGKIAHAHLHALLDEAQTNYADAIEKARQAVLTVEGKTGRAAVGSTEMTFDDFVEDADLAVIEDAYKRAARMISPDVAKTYSEYLAAKNADAEDEEDALIEAHTDVAAIGLVPAIQDDLEAAAEVLANQWLTTHEEEIKTLTDERQDVYRELRELSANPLDVSLAMPRNSLQPTIEVMEDGTEVALPAYKDHLLCDESGFFPVKIRLNDWELEVLSQEANRDGFIAWYRNPSSASPESLGVIYPIDGNESIMRPDFIFFSKGEDGTVQVNIVDPHGDHLADSLPKLVGLANYAETHANLYTRIVSVSKAGGVFRYLDLKDTEVREAIKLGPSAKALFGGPKAKPYPS
ncbi:DEAD/DEAH box helicase [Phaeobacter inhibens]|uniref:DEAD/DEAH box helicase n=1 Tax=Phaeobacter inhibens TaxID=221822 RepID=UPI00076BB8FB|nr:DEAD/DEAH box helicase family protein [Phaeobacter inhibens]KXF90269.1 type III restriction endonuclease subunit R [Phaeobacter inhibens]WHP69112.1 DEAD/DEAH box helicase family protein [Phaeobacter inhibens]